MILGLLKKWKSGYVLTTPQKPLADMADTGYDNMSQGEGYILFETKDFARQTNALLESKSTLDVLWNLLD